MVGLGEWFVGGRCLWVNRLISKKDKDTDHKS